MACAVRHFGDELRLKINPIALGYAPTNDPETIIDLAIGKFPTATIERRFLNPPTTHLINEIYNLLLNPRASGNTADAFRAWRALPTVGGKPALAWSMRLAFTQIDSTVCGFVDLLAKYSDSNLGSPGAFRGIQAYLWI